MLTSTSSLGIHMLLVFVKFIYTASNLERSTISTVIILEINAVFDLILKKVVNPRSGIMDKCKAYYSNI